jgi:hypothetical protein
MESAPLLIFARLPVSVPLRYLREASEEELASQEWEAAFLRWATPEMHEVFYLERQPLSEDEEAQQSLARAVGKVHSLPISAGRYIAADHLQQTEIVYAIHPLPALLLEDDHPAWAALDALLRYLAIETDGMIYAEGEGFYDSEGENLLSETEDEEE